MSRPVVHAAGGVLWRGDTSAPEVAVIHRPAYDDWSLPKGKAKTGEHLLLTALREVEEETGGRGVLGPHLMTTRYRVVSHRRLADKVVSYWAIRWLDGDFEVNREVDEIRWMPVGEARRQVTKRSDAAVLQSFERAPRDTRPLVLMRHGATSSQTGKARRKRQALSRTGRDQAAALVPLLHTLGAERLLSADLPACTDTLRPFGRAAGVEVQVDPRLTKAAFSEHEVAVADDLRRAVAEQTMVVCSSRRVIAELVDSLSRGSTTRPPHDTSLRKGGWWLLHLDNGDVRSYERHEPAA